MSDVSIEVRTVAAVLGALVHEKLTTVPINPSLRDAFARLHKEGKLFRNNDAENIKAIKTFLLDPQAADVCLRCLTPEAEAVLKESVVDLPKFVPDKEQNDAAMGQLNLGIPVADRVEDKELADEVGKCMNPAEDDRAVRVLIVSGTSGSGKTTEGKATVPSAIASKLKKTVHVYYVKFLRTAVPAEQCRAIRKAHNTYLRSGKDEDKVKRDKLVTLFDNMLAVRGVTRLLDGKHSSDVLLVVLDEAGAEPAVMRAIASLVCDKATRPFQDQIDLRVCFVGTGADAAASRIGGDGQPISYPEQVRVFHTSEACGATLLDKPRFSAVKALVERFPLVGMFAENRRGIYALEAAIKVATDLRGYSVRANRLEPHSTDKLDAAMMRAVSSGTAQDILTEAIRWYVASNGWRDVDEKGFCAVMALARAAVCDVEQCDRAAFAVDRSAEPTPPQEFENYAVISLGCLQWSTAPSDTEHRIAVELPHSMCVVAMYLADMLPSMSANFQSGQPWETQAAQCLSVRALGLRAFWPSDLSSLPVNLQRPTTVWDLLSPMFSRATKDGSARESTGPRPATEAGSRHVDVNGRSMMKAELCTLPPFEWAGVHGWVFGVASPALQCLPEDLTQALDENTGEKLVATHMQGPYLLPYLNAPKADFWDGFLFTQELLVVLQMKDWSDSIGHTTVEAELKKGGVLASSSAAAKSRLVYLQKLGLQEGVKPRLVVPLLAAARHVGDVNSEPFSWNEGDGVRVVREVGLVTQARWCGQPKDSTSSDPMRMLAVCRAATPHAAKRPLE